MNDQRRLLLRLYKKQSKQQFVLVVFELPQMSSSLQCGKHISFAKVKLAVLQIFVKQWSYNLSFVSLFRFVSCQPAVSKNVDLTSTHENICVWWLLQNQKFLSLRSHFPKEGAEAIHDTVRKYSNFFWLKTISSPGTGSVLQIFELHLARCVLTLS